jgi:hypothetical protein
METSEVCRQICPVEKLWIGMQYTVPPYMDTHPFRWARRAASVREPTFSLA